MRNYRSALGILSALAFANVASAAPETGTRIDRAPSGAVTDRDVDGENAAEIAMSRFARCAANLHRRDAEALLALPYQTEEQSKAAARIAGKSSRCLDVAGGQLRFKAASLVGGIAETLVLLRYPGIEAKELNPFPETSFEPAGLAPRTLAEDFAQCVAAKDPKSTLALIKSEVASLDEENLVKQLTPKLGPCLTADTTLALNTRSVRLMLAVGLHRLMPLLAPSAVKVN